MYDPDRSDNSLEIVDPTMTLEGVDRLDDVPLHTVFSLRKAP